MSVPAGLFYAQNRAGNMCEEMSSSWGRVGGLSSPKVVQELSNFWSLAPPHDTNNAKSMTAPMNGSKTAKILPRKDLKPRKDADTRGAVYTAQASSHAED